jgi:predicted nucleic acid-binding protein
MRWLLDTNVISEAARRSPAPEVLRWVDEQKLETIYTLSLACAEIRAGIALIANEKRKAELEDWLAHKVRPLFGSRILNADEQLWLCMLDILERAKRCRRTTPITDLIFAAAAERHDMVLVTRNVKDFVGTGVRVLNPWVAAPTIEIA